MKMSFNVFVEFIQLIVILKSVSSIPLLAVTENSTVIDELPHETQHAICKVFTKEIEATAKATITRQLKGVCSSREFNLRLDRLHQELQQIKQALGIRDQHNQYKSLDVASTTHEPLSHNISFTALPMYEYSDYVEPEDNIKYTKKDVGTKSSDNNQLRNNAKLNEEIINFNDTVVESSEGDLYFYYWRIPEINKILKKKNIYISSPSFSVLGHTLHLQFYPNYLSEYVGILLKPQSNSFLKKHKITYLGQRSTQNEISSRILYGIKNEDKIFKIGVEMLTNDFIFRGSLLVKIKIYLNS